MTTTPPQNPSPYGEPDPIDRPQYSTPGQYPAAGQYPAPSQDPAPGTAPGSRYGTQPYAPMGQGGVLPEPRRHRTLLTLTLASAALWLLANVPPLFGLDDMMRVVRESVSAEGGVPPEDVDRFEAFFRASFIGGVVVALLIGLAVYALVYFGLRAVKNWARIVGIVAAILGTLGALAGLLSFTTFPGLAGVIASLASLGLLVVNILWLVNAFSGEEAAYTRQGRPAGA
ncbi:MULTISPECIES: hypothetical protein [unclassified Micrococcus]|uniref:hypothetical protein n=1 Tax=Micrococcus TaxID=1269 RepID=UPI002003BED5|nr:MULTISPECIES: hypothetical protein [unclassified Micrococcus]MDX2341155.1 hypothetical protein [Micrococcus sp. M4NT]